MSKLRIKNDEDSTIMSKQVSVSIPVTFCTDFKGTPFPYVNK